MEVFTKGELIRINKTGEVFTYENATGGANFSSYLTINIRGALIDYRKALHVDEVSKVNEQGTVIDDFKTARNKINESTETQPRSKIITPQTLAPALRLALIDTGRVMCRNSINELTDKVFNEIDKT